MTNLPLSLNGLRLRRALWILFASLLTLPVHGQVIDDFERSDSSDIGNGWVEKSPNAFSLNAGLVEKNQVSSSYRNNVVFRPAGENLLDVETSVEFRLDRLPPRYPQIFARIQTDTALAFDSLDAYILYVSNNAQTAVLGRQTGSSFVAALATISLSPALNATDTFRLRLAVTGTNPVNLDAYVERFNGADWQIIGVAGVTDSAGNRIVNAGSVGFGGSHWEDQYRYDNFSRTDLGGGGSNPLPSITSIDPSAATAGDPAFTLAVNGAGFVSSSVVRWNDSDRPTTFVSATRLEADISAADIAAEGTATVTVASPAPGGGVSSGQTFTIDSAPVNNPLPVLGAIAPSSATEGDPGFTLTATGSDFIDASVVRWNGSDRATTFISASELQADISAADIASAGTASVTVANPGPGGGVSGGQTFTIDQAPPADNPLPVLNSIAPNNATAGDPGFTLTAFGSDFVASSTVRWNGSDRTTTFISATELRADIGAGDIAVAGQASVTVATPGPGGGVSGQQTFTILEPTVDPNPAPSLDAVWPVFALAGSGPVSVTLWGDNFGDYSVARFNGEVVTSFFNGNRELTIELSDVELANPGIYNIDVVNPAPGGGTSSPVAFEVDATNGDPLPPVLTGVSPGAATLGSGSTVITVTGNRFTADSEVMWNGSSRPTVFINAQSLQATINAADLQVEQIATVTVSTPAPGGGVSRPQNFFVTDPATSYFFDNFNRPNSTTIGNDWTEKSDVEFGLFNGEVLSTVTRQDYKDNIFHRPLDEDRRDVEVSVEIRRLRGPANLPQLHARVQRDSIATPQSIESYIFFVVDNNQPPIEAAFAIQPADEWAECFIATFQFPSELQFDERYRLRFRLSGSVPVQMFGYVDHWNGQTWDLFASGSTIHDYNTQLDPNLFCHPGYMPPPITTGGSMGLAKYRPRSDAYDNYYWRDFVSDPGLNPSPVLNSLNPASATAGDPDLTLTVNGVGFVQGAVVRWDGADRQTTFISSNQLSAQIPAQDLAQPTTASVTVFNPGPGGGESSPQNFVVQDPGDPGPGPSDVLDDFERPDSPDLGNGWVEKNPAAFSLTSGGARKLAVSTGYRDNVVYRPAAENMLNTETSVELRLNAASPGYPQLLARIQTDTVLTPGSLTGYILYISNSNGAAILGRQRGGNFVTALANITLTSQLNTTDLFRLRLRVEGTAPVALNAYVERWNGSSWDIIGQGAASDSGGLSITSPGSTGFGGYVESAYTYDNFDAVDLDQ